MLHLNFSSLYALVERNHLNHSLQFDHLHNSKTAVIGCLTGWKLLGVGFGACMSVNMNFIDFFYQL